MVVLLQSCSFIPGMGYGLGYCNVACQVDPGAVRKLTAADRCGEVTAASIFSTTIANHENILRARN
jgi:hypothetical protein